MLIKVSRSALHGQGCFAIRPISPGEEVARVRILVLTPAESAVLSQTSLKNYLFYVRDGEGEAPPYTTALAMGPVSFCNHDPAPNCDFAIDEDAGEIALTANRAVSEGEEITISYGDYADEII